MKSLLETLCVSIFTTRAVRGSQIICIANIMTLLLKDSLELF